MNVMLIRNEGASMGHHPRVESRKVATFQTTRSQNSELWFVNNSPLERAILGYAAKYATRYRAKLYALAIEGNHFQFPAMFPGANRAHFMRDFNAAVARAVPRYQPGHPGGRLWGRRYSAEYLPGNEDIEEQFFYTALQPVQDGLVSDIKDYPGYNCFEDAIHGRSRTVQVVRWKEFNDARRWNSSVSITDFTDDFYLKFARLPGYEKLSQGAYVRMMREKLRARTEQIVRARGSKGVAGTAALLKVKPGSRPKHTKESGPTDHRPRVLSKDPSRRSKGKAWYFAIYFAYVKASAAYRGGSNRYAFPPGTYKPPAFTVAHSGEMLSG
jgi:hypothetical protein